MSRIKYIWKVHTRVPKPKSKHTTVPCQMTIVAEHIDQVWDYIAADRADERTEVVALIRGEPVVAVLAPKKSPEAEPNLAKPDETQ